MLVIDYINLTEFVLAAGMAVGIALFAGCGVCFIQRFVSDSPRTGESARSVVRNSLLGRTTQLNLSSATAFM